jgi:hypothetical protein
MIGGAMNPTDEVPESAVNGQTASVAPPASAALKAKTKPKKGQLL